MKYSFDKCFELVIAQDEDMAFSILKIKAVRTFYMLTFLFYLYYMVMFMLDAVIPSMID